MKSRVVHVAERIPGAVYIGPRDARYGLPQSPFANPFTVEVFGRRGAIELYRHHINDLVKHNPDMLDELHDRPLACWCRHDGEAPRSWNACHGDVLIQLLAQRREGA